MRYLFLIICLMYSLNLPAAIYQSKDKQGVVHFSDMLIEGGQLMSLEKSQIDYLFAKNVDDKKDAVKTASNLQQQGYKLLQIDQPQNDAILRNNHGVVEVQITVEPALKSEHKIIALLDGNLAGKSEGTQFQLTNVDRGAHTLQLQIETKQGQVLAYSKHINFQMQRPKKVNQL